MSIPFRGDGLYSFLEEIRGLRSGAAFECVADNGELITIRIAWKNSEEKYASFGPLKDTFRRRGVRRYVFKNECWFSSGSDFKGPPRADPNRTEKVMVSGVERNGPRKEFVADIKRQGTKATLGPWELIDRSDPESSSSWWGLELMEEGYSDRPKMAGSSLPETLKIGTKADLEDLLDEHPNAANDMQSVIEVSEGVWDLLCQLQQGKDDGDQFDGQFWAGFEQVTMIVIGGLVQFPDMARKMKSVAQLLRDHPDRYPMFASVPFVHPSEHQRDRYGLALHTFLTEMGKQGHSELAVLNAFINVFIRVGVVGMGALRLTDFIDAKLADSKQLSEMIRQMHGETENKAA